MGYYRKWKPSKTQTREFAETMREIEQFCADNHINQSRNGDSYYFTINGTEYRVSNHSVEASNRAAFNDLKNGFELDGRGNRKG